LGRPNIYIIYWDIRYYSNIINFFTGKSFTQSFFGTPVQL
jgi:hypothetical protein